MVELMIGGVQDELPFPREKITSHPYRPLSRPWCDECGGARKEHATEYLWASEPDCILIEES